MLNARLYCFVLVIGNTIKYVLNFQYPTIVSYNNNIKVYSDIELITEEEEEENVKDCGM